MGNPGRSMSRLPDVALDARKPNRCVLSCRSCGAPVRIPRSSPRLVRHRSPHAAELAVPAFVARAWRPPDICLERDNMGRCAAIRPGSMRGVLGLPATPAFMPRVCRPDRFSAQRTVSRARRALRSLCWCISQAAVRYAAATRAFDAGQASRRNVGVSAHNDCQGSRQKRRHNTIASPTRHAPHV